MSEQGEDPVTMDLRVCQHEEHNAQNLALEGYY